MAPKAKSKPPPPAAAAAPAPSVPIEDLCSNLNGHIQNFEYDQAAKVADQVLAIAPGDEDAVRCKVVALVKSDAIDKALSAIQGFAALPIDLNFYKAQELVSALPDMFPDSITPVLLQEAVHVREKKVSKAEEILGQFADKFPEKSKPVLLARAQIAAAAGHSLISAESLSRIPDIQHKPATVATIVSLRERLGDVNGAAAVLDSAIQWWRNAMTEDNKLNVVVQQAASFKLNHGREEEASQLYEELVKTRGSSIEALVGLVMTAAHTNLEKAESYEKQLRALSGLKGINAETLEKTHGAKQVEGVGKMEVSEEVKKVRAKKRKRKPRYPKGFDPANPGPPPDPERWLPKRERSSYRPRRKDKRAQVRGSQGAVIREKHDSAAAANTTSSSNQKAVQGNASAAKGKSATSSEQQPRASNKSRKKKSRS